MTKIQMWLIIYYYWREAYITVQTFLWQTYNTNLIGTIESTLTASKRSVGKACLIFRAVHSIDIEEKKKNLKCGTHLGGTIVKS